MMPKQEKNTMPNFTIKENYQLTKIPDRIFVEQIGEEGKYYCPYCYVRCGETSSMCSNCGKSLAEENKDVVTENSATSSDSDSVKSILIKERLESCIPILEENKLLNKKALSKMKEADYEKIGITAIGDRKLLVSLFAESSNKGCIVAIIVTVAVLIGVIILLHYLGVFASLAKALESFAVATLVLIFAVLIFSNL